MPSKVAVIKTSPSTVVQDYARLSELCGFSSEMKKGLPSILKINLSWTKFFPACSTPPWQLDAVLDLMKKLGITDIHAVENQTVVTHPWKGAYYNKWLPVLKKHGVPFEPLTDVKWKGYSPKSEMLAMTKTFDKILVPEMFFGANVIHVPTMKTHGHTTTTGSMKNAFGGLIPKYRHHAHKRIHEILVDLLAIQREIHPSIFTFMDGTVAGNGAGPRTMVPVNANMILASADPVAIDAVSARLMGFDPMKIDYLRIAHDMGLGSADVDSIEILGMDEK
ncbi:MAG: DUF362 domain-containing protein, partial [Candidatus Thermoplasmatota archaeon]|nr:DUF362 domain-containing protein [Candidatus Thermoplasmatota archaeon]